MGILFLDSSSKIIEFGYAENSQLIIEEKLDSNYNADTLTYFLKKSFEKHSIDFKNIEVVSLSNGPGSFTGLRIGSAIAKGICFANDCRLIEISTLDIIANKHKSDKEIIALIFSNSKTLEFYYCEYRYRFNKLNRVSDYKIGIAENICHIKDAEFVINEYIDENINQVFMKNLINIAGQSNIFSQFELTRTYIENNQFTDYKISQPFYMKEFIPKI